jgi:hypothetical protein
VQCAGIKGTNGPALEPFLINLAASVIILDRRQVGRKAEEIGRSLRIEEATYLSI